MFIDDRNHYREALSLSVLTMLPAFRVRDLHLYIRESSSPASSQEGMTEHHPLVRITDSQYDDTVSDHPVAKLSYVDDDDGEIVTVRGK